VKIKTVKLNVILFIWYSLLSAEKKEILIKKLWQSQKYCDEIQASRIPGKITSLLDTYTILFLIYLPKKHLNYLYFI
jgi:hypothetical protein